MSWSDNQATHQEAVDTIHEVRGISDPKQRYFRCLQLLESSSAALELSDAKFRSFTLVMVTVAQDPTSCQ